MALTALLKARAKNIPKVMKSSSKAANRLRNSYQGARSGTAKMVWASHRQKMKEVKEVIPMASVLPSSRAVGKVQRLLLFL